MLEKLHQLSRLVETNKLNFETSHYVIFSDVPTIEGMRDIVDAAKWKSNEFSYKFIDVLEVQLARAYADSLTA